MADGHGRYRADVINVDGLKTGDVVPDGATPRRPSSARQDLDDGHRQLNPRRQLPAQPTSSSAVDGLNDFLNSPIPVQGQRDVEGQGRRRPGGRMAVEWLQGQRRRRQQRRQHQGLHWLRRIRPTPSRTPPYARLINKEARRSRRRWPRSRPPPPTLRLTKGEGGFYQILTDQPGAPAADYEPPPSFMPKQPKDTAAAAEALEVLRLVLRQRRQGRRGARLHPDALDNVVGMIRKSWADEIKSADGKPVFQK